MDIKSELKLARDFIKKKDYKDALKHCKNVLKADKENYNALVFIGKCATEMEQFQQAKEAYNRAIESNKEQPLAWQGLCSLLEKAKNKAWNNDLISAYKVLLENDSILKDVEKWLDLCMRHVHLLQEVEKYSEALEALEKSLSFVDVESQRKIYEEIINVTKKIIIKEGPVKEIILKLKNGYEQVLSSEKVEKENLNAEYLQFILQNVKHNLGIDLKKMLSICKRSHSDYPDNKLIGGVFQEVLFNTLISVDELVPLESIQLLELLSSDEQTSTLLHGISAMESGDYLKVIRLFEKVLEENCENIFAVFYLSIFHLKLHHYDKIKALIQTARSFSKHLKFNESIMNLEQRMDYLEVEMMLENKLNENDKENVLSKLNKYESSEASMLKIGLHLKLSDIESAANIIDKLEESMTQDASTKMKMLQLKGEISLVEKKYFDAELRLQEALDIKESYKTHFLLGKTYWCLGESNQEYLPKAYTEFLKAAKLDANYSPTFYYLGKYQKELIKDLGKATKCLEKSFSLNPSNEEAASMLADLYLKTDKQDKAAEIYAKITKEARVGECIWAWIRLGLIYTKRKQHDEAIVCFQNGLRGDTSISHHWECLAEAYFEKGSYQSALKSFVKAVELDTSSSYCKFRIAKIKQMLKMDADAVDDYKKLLEEHPDYIPALLGLSETYLHLEKEKLKIVFDGSAVDCAQNVVNYITRAIEKQPTFSILWKTVADSLTSLHVVCDHKCRLTIPKALLKILSFELHSEFACKKDILEIASRCYMVAIKLKENISCYWHDLAVCAYYQAVVVKGQEGRGKIAQSIQIIKKAISMDSTNHRYWNTLGVVSGSSGPTEKICGHSIDDSHDPSLSQHAFIKALEINAQDAQVWANLGVLYLKHDKVEAAHEAFKKAQACDPALTQAWIGQAIVAESVMKTEDDRYEAMDLFRHSTELHFHGEGSLAYAQWVCRLLNYIKNDSVIISTTPKADMSHLPLDVRRIVSKASVSLQKSTERYTTNAYAFNTLGILLEQEGLLKQADHAFTCARKLLSTQASDTEHNQQLRKVLLNQARVLCYLKEFEKAIEIFKVCEIQTAKEACSLALAYYKAGQLDNSIEEYEKALNLCTNDSDRSGVLAAMGMVYYAQEKIDSAKSSLFQSTQQRDNNEHGIMALAALGLLHGDGTLATAALLELSKHKHNTMILFEKKKIKLTVAFYQLQGQTQAARRELLQAIHKYPQEAHFWAELSRFIMNNDTNRYQLSLHCTKVANKHGPTKVATLCDAMTSLAFPIYGTKDLKRSVQRLIHNHPENAESWVVLAAALNADAAFNHGANRTSNLMAVQITSLALKKVDEELTSLKSKPSRLPILDTLILNQYSNLYSWMMQLYVINNIYYGDNKLAQSFADKVLPSLKGDNKAFEEFVFLKGLSSIQEDLSKGDQLSLENIRVMMLLATKTAERWKWMVLSKIYCTLSMHDEAQICLRQLISLDVQKNKMCNNALLQLCLLSIKAHDATSEEKWLPESKEIMDQLFGSVPEPDHVMIVLRAIIFQREGNKKAAMKYLQKLVFTDTIIAKLVEVLMKKWK